MPVWVGPVVPEVVIGTVLPDGREVLEVQYRPSVRALVSNYGRQAFARRHPNIPIEPPLSEDPIRFVRVGGFKGAW